MTKIGVWRVASAERNCETKRKPSNESAPRLTIMRSNCGPLVVTAMASTDSQNSKSCKPSSACLVRSLALSRLSTQSTRPGKSVSLTRRGSTPDAVPSSARWRNSSVNIFKRTRDRKRLNSAKSFTGLVRKSSAPALRPLMRSSG